jgi:short-subunit dehydrogenase
MEIKSLNPDIETKIVIADFQEAQTIGFFQKIVDELKYLNIGILINNVGIMVSGKFQ